MLELHDVGFGYTPGAWIFRHVNLQVVPGTITAVLGPNGRGKTTLVKCAAGLLQPREGTVDADGAVGFVPQARSAAFAYSSLEMVVMGRLRQVRVFGVPSRGDWVAARDAMERIGIGHLQDRQFPTLSGGEQQLVLIARAVASDSSTLVLDEPSSGLDLHNQARIMSLLRKLVADGLGVLLTTHHPDHALYLADDVVLMGEQDVRIGPAAQLLTDEALSQLYAIDVQTLTYQHGAHDRRTIITRYGDELD